MQHDDNGDHFLHDLLHELGDDSVQQNEANAAPSRRPSSLVMRSNFERQVERLTQALERASQTTDAHFDVRLHYSFEPERMRPSYMLISKAFRIDNKKVTEAVKEIVRDAGQNQTNAFVYSPNTIHDLFVRLGDLEAFRARFRRGENRLTTANSKKLGKAFEDRNDFHFLLDPITMEVIEDAVTLVPCGHSCSLSSVQGMNSKCAICRAPIERHVNNHALREACAWFNTQVPRNLRQKLI